MNLDERTRNELAAELLEVTNSSLAAGDLVAANDFGPELADELARMLRAVNRFNGRMKLHIALALTRGDRR